MKDTVIIIGAGFCGTLVAAHLLARGPSGLRVRLIERAGRFGPGIAYGRAEPQHLLNVPAGNMSAFAADSDHFVRFAKTRWPLATGGDFLPRATYGEYLEQVLSDAEAARPGSLDRVHGEAVALARLLPAFGDLSQDLADRMVQDLCFDNGPAVSDFGYAPRSFRPDSSMLRRTGAS